MEQIKLSFPANRALSGKALAGGVGAGRMGKRFQQEA